jgi:putative hydrolase of the HAD superfamily
MPMRFDMLAFDADDTLWDNECFYQDTQSALLDLLASYDVDREMALTALHRVDVDNLATFGYGTKGFTLSMVEAAIELTSGRIRAVDVQAIIGLGRAMLTHEVRLLAHSAETVTRLAQTHPLMIITKGDLMDQERKLAASGLAGNFVQVEIVSNKTPAVYAALLERHGLAPERFLMVGNSMRSDILPVLDLGGWAVHVPYHLQWAHEAGAAPTGADGRFHELDHLGQLPDLVERIENGS